MDQPSLDQTYLSAEQGSLLLALVAGCAIGHQEEIPVGAVLQDSEGRYLSELGNNTVKQSDPTGHAEIRVMRQAAVRIGNYRLIGTSLAVTLMPCPMCLAALKMARVAKISFEAQRPTIPLSTDSQTELIQTKRPDAGSLLIFFFDKKRKA